MSLFSFTVTGPDTLARPPQKTYKNKLKRNEIKYRTHPLSVSASPQSNDVISSESYK